MLNAKVDLITEDYYAQELVFQEVVDRRKATASDNKVPLLDLDRDRNMLTIWFNWDTNQVDRPVGTITFLRPSDADLDTELSISVNTEGKQLVPLSAFQKGLWLVKVKWDEGSKKYLHEAEIVV